MIGDSDWEIQAMNEQHAEEDAQREEAESLVVNGITDYVKELIEDYGWSEQDVLDHVRSVLA
jgi:hypothetical protein